jgi:hypothetical protein
MKKILLLAALSSTMILTANASAGELHNYKEIEAAVLHGRAIHIVVDFTKCTVSKKDMTDAMSSAVFTPNAISVMSDHIATSLKHFTLNDPSYPNQPIYEFVRYTINSDNSLVLSDQALDAVSYAALGDKQTITCTVDTSAKVYA